MIKSANTRNRDRVCSFKTTESEEFFMLMGNYGRK